MRLRRFLITEPTQTSQELGRLAANVADTQVNSLADNNSPTRLPLRTIGPCVTLRLLGALAPVFRMYSPHHRCHMECCIGDDLTNLARKCP
jgi:hypothetical protein